MSDCSTNAWKEPDVLYMHPTYDAAYYGRLKAIEVAGVRFERTGKQSKADMYRRQLGGTQAALRREQQRVKDLERELAGRECEVDNTIQWQWAGPTTYYEYELSCGHVVTSEDKEPPSYCEECGAKVREAVEQ